jgi:hypothetical protein
MGLAVTVEVVEVVEDGATVEAAVAVVGPLPSRHITIIRTLFWQRRIAQTALLPDD